MKLRLYFLRVTPGDMSILACLLRKACASRFHAQQKRKLSIKAEAKPVKLTNYWTIISLIVKSYC